MSGKYINRLPRGMPADQTRALSDVFQDLHRDATQFQSEFSDGSTRTVRDRLGDTVHLSDFKGTYTEQWQAAVASGAKKLYVDAGGTLTAQIDIPAYMYVWSDMSYQASIVKGFNGDMFTLGSYSTLQGLWLEGNGATYTGRGLLCNTGTSDQKVLGCVISDMNGYCIEFTANNAGAGFQMIGWFVGRTTATNDAIKLPANEPLTDGTRYFSMIRTGGRAFMDVSGGNMTFIDMCNFTTITMSSNSKQFHMSNCRHAGALTLDGSTPQISGCSIGGSVTVASTCGDAQLTNNKVAGSLILNSLSSNTRADDTNAFSGGVTDNSGNASNYVYAEGDFTPTWGADTTNPAIGNGTLTGRYTRRGRHIRACISMTAGSTTTFGTGPWFFQMPSGLNATVKRLALGSARCNDSGTAFYAGICYTNSGAAPKIYVRFGGPVGNEVGSTIPFAWTTNDSLDLDIEWEVG